jgi:quercetin dioxygenase-like cupin family protein
MIKDQDWRDEPASRGTRIDRRTIIGHSVGAAVVGAVFGGSADLTAAVTGAVGQASGSTSGISLPEGIRRIVTGHDEEGQSYVISDDRVTVGRTFPNLFKTTGDDPFGPGPEPQPRTLYPTDSPQLEPEVGGASFQFVTLPPMSPDAPLGWHRTETVDINILLGGELVLVLDTEEVTLHPGDVVIQRNTMHAWKNSTDSPVHWAAVLVPIRQRT